MELARIIQIGIEFASLDGENAVADSLLLKEQGFLDYVSSVRPEVTTGQRAVDTYEVQGETVVQVWVVVNDGPYYKIERLRSRLAITDSKVIECFEANACGYEPPYDISALHLEREEIRNGISNLELMLQTYE